MTDDEDRPKKRPIDYRDHRLVIALLGVLYEAQEDLTYRELETLFADTPWNPTTITKTVTDLVAFGAVRSVRPFRASNRTPSKLRITLLGRAWVDRRLEPYVGADPDPLPEADSP